MAYSIKFSALILILLLSQIRVLLSTDKTADSTIHIYLSFWGPDTRQNFTSLLYKEFFRAGFNVFMNEESIRNGRDVDSGKKEAIRKSMGAVIIFSKEFASWECCLNELVLIIEQRELRSDYILLPIYVEGVKPDDIGTKGGSYGTALAKHKKRYWFWNKKDQAWWAALRKIEGCKGKILADRNWDRFFNEIVEETRQEFSLMGITVNPRSEPSRRDPEDGLPTFVKLLRGLGTLGNLIDQNPSSFPVISQSSIQQHHQSVQNKKNVELEKGSGSVWGWGSVAAFTICFSLLVFIGCSIRSNKERESIEDPADPPRMPETVIGTSTTSERQNSAMARPSNTPTRIRPEEEESLVSSTSEVLNSSMVSMEKAPTWIQPKPDPSCGIQKCKNLSRTSASPLEGNDEKEELESFSPGDDDDDASLESSITGSTSNAPKKSVITSTKEVPTKIQPKPDPSCGIQKCKNLSRTSASPLEGNDEKEELESFSPGDDDDDASLESSITGSTSNAPKKSVITSTKEVPTKIQPKPDPSCGIQKCKNLSRTSASPLEGNDEKEELESFSPGDDDASLESSITGSTSNAPKKSVIASTKEVPTKIQPKPNPQNSNNTKYPLGREARVVLYTSYGPLFQTKFKCNEVKDILRDAGVEFVERDASKNSMFKIELQKLMGDELSYPRLVVRRRDVGEVEELKNITHLMTIIND